MEYRVSKMTWDQLKDKSRESGVAILPFGTTERHRQHLPMETDAAIATKIAEITGRKSGAAVFPTIPFGIIESTAFPGIFLSQETYHRLLKEIVFAIEAIGFFKILFLSGHHQNNPTIFSVMKELYAEKPDKRVYCMAHCMTLIGEIMPAFIRNRKIGHADFRETSLMLAIEEATVHMGKVDQMALIDAPLAGGLKSVGIHCAQFREGGVKLCHEIQSVTEYGGYGQLEGSSKAAGMEIIEKLSDYLSKLIGELKNL
jgi:creatinine amidohydrolase